MAFYLQITPIEITRICPTTSSPAVKATQKKIFDTAFDKTTWHLQPSIILFLTPMAVLKQVDTNNDVELRMFKAPVNHNKLDEKKTLQIINTILGNTYQHENEITRQNQDFGLDACVIVGYDNNNLKEK
jgi:hypothetical protein